MRLDHPAQRRLDVLERERLGGRQRLAGRRSVSTPPSRPIIFSNASGSSTGPSKMNPTSGQKSASVWIFSREISTAPRSPVRPVYSSSRSVSSSIAELAQVAAVHVAQLALVEHGRVLRHALEAEALGQLVAA